MMMSFWEKQLLDEYDFLVVGAGIMGCSVAFELREKYANAKIGIIERDYFSCGASTKNAGFACFGSPTEILHDIQLMGEQNALELVRKRYEGLQILTNRIADAGRTNLGGYELMLQDTLSKSEIQSLNEILFPIFKQTVFVDASKQIHAFQFSNIAQMIYTAFEAQVDSGKLLTAYWQLLQSKNIRFFNGLTVKKLLRNEIEAESSLNGNITCRANKIFICTNAFPIDTSFKLPIKPGRGQVLITSPIEGLPFSGSFHFDAGFYYFRNVGNRVLFGGSRNLDFTSEETTDFAPNQLILDDLKLKLKEIILSNFSFSIEQEWQGIMAFSENKLPLIHSMNQYATYLMACNGMGVALCPFVAKEIVDKL